jgi:pimeloyl-ACP methyl ester carboxylesterase
MILRTVRMGEGSPIVLLHGLFGAASNWGRVQRRLAANHLVLALDARNHGASPHDRVFTYPAMAQDVLDTLDAEGITDTALLGHSMGGKIAMHLALKAPERVTRLVVADIAPVAYPPHFQDLAAAMIALPLRPGLTRAEASAALEPAAPDPGVRSFVLQNLRFGATPTSLPKWRNGLGEIAAGLPDIALWTGQGIYSGPVLVLRGERSDYIQPEHRPLFRAHFPQARFATLRGAGHWLHADAPEAFLQTVDAFLTPSPSPANGRGPG